MGRMVAVEEWAEIHGKTPATVRRKIHANAWPDAKQATLDGKRQLSGCCGPLGCRC